MKGVEMKKILFFTALMVSALSLIPALTMANTCIGQKVADMIADGGGGGGVDVGDVLVCYSDSTLKVVFDTSSTGWCMSKTHLDVAYNPNNIPQKNGNPIPGQFDYQHVLGSCDLIDEYEVPITVLATTLYIAAHADVWDTTTDTTLNVVSSQNTAIIEADAVAVDENASLAYEPFNYPNCGFYSQTNDGTNSVWDSQIQPACRTVFNSLGADWIWRSPGYPDPASNEQILGQVITFQEEFDAVGLVTQGTLSVTADNAFTASLNGIEVASSVSLGPGFPGTLREKVDTTPQTGNWGVASQGWQNCLAYNVGGSLVSGENVLTIIASNEYMWNSTGYDGPDQYYGWNNGTKTYNTGSINNDPNPGTGASGSSSTGNNICRNPGGLIFALSVDYYARGETAWGDGTDFGGKKWATYITYPINVD
jgi:hypothetical protein